jgi:RNA polymerase sigma-70 factor, ECF subfamily
MSAEIASAIAAAQKGDKDAFHLLYRQFLGRVYAVCLRMLGDAQKAEDATQEVFIKVWQQLPDFRADSAFATWLHSIATRTAIDLWRRDRMLRLVDSDAPEEQGAEAGTADAQDLEQAIRRLPAQARAVFVLYALEGYKHQEIAVLLGIAEGSSKAHYHRARQLLQEHLNDEQPAIRA